MQPKTRRLEVFPASHHGWTVEGGRDGTMGENVMMCVCLGWEEEGMPSAGTLISLQRLRGDVHRCYFWFLYILCSGLLYKEPLPPPSRSFLFILPPPTSLFFPCFLSQRLAPSLYWEDGVPPPPRAEAFRSSPIKKIQ